MQPAVYFLGDVHLGGPQAGDPVKSEASLVAFLGWLRGRAQVLYLLGDLFDFWFEFHSGAPRGYERVLQAIRELCASGSSVILIPGNHDAWPGRTLSRLGLRIARGEVRAAHFDRRVLVAHGDGWARSDRGYRALSILVRTPVLVSMFKLWPVSLGTRLARWASSESRTHTQERQHRFAPEYRAAVRKRLRSGFDLVVLGHTHEVVLERFPEGTYMNPGLWYPDLRYGVIDERGPALCIFDWQP